MHGETVKFNFLNNFIIHKDVWCRVVMYIIWTCLVG